MEVRAQHEASWQPARDRETAQPTRTHWGRQGYGLASTQGQSSCGHNSGFPPRCPLIFSPRETRPRAVGAHVPPVHTALPGQPQHQAGHRVKSLVRTRAISCIYPPGCAPRSPSEPRLSQGALPPVLRGRGDFPRTLGRMCLAPSALRTQPAR